MQMLKLPTASRVMMKKKRIINNLSVTKLMCCPAFCIVETKTMMSKRGREASDDCSKGNLKRENILKSREKLL